jgi:very-short-patch-repair endonuclease
MVVSHESALEFWRLYGRFAADVGKRSRMRSLPKTPPSNAEPGIALDYLVQRPIRLIVGDADARRSYPDISFHFCGGVLPAGALLDTSQGLRVSSPECCFLQMASRLSLLESIKLGYELCGSYRLLPDPEYVDRGFISAQPLTSTAKLADFLARVSGIKGRKRALRALRYIADDSASPRETALTMLLCLPYKLGGFGFRLPQINYRVDISKTRRALASKSYYVCDLYWPERKLAVEYDSDQFHADVEQIASDAKRRNALGALGLTVITVTRQQLNVVAEFNKVAALISKHLGKRIQYNDPGFTRAHRALRKMLFSVEGIVPLRW